MFRFSFSAMGSPCSLQLANTNEANAEKLLQLVRAEIERLEQRYSRFRTDSLLSDINRIAAQGGSLKVDEETAALLDYAHTCYQQSGGRFDITAGILHQAWKLDARALPDVATIESLLQGVGWHRLQWSRPELSFPVAGMSLDLGGIVKEYAADRVITLIREQGIDAAVIELGGDIATLGQHPEGRPWQVGIRAPERPEQTLCSLPLRPGAIATSGDYQRCIRIGNQRYGHVLNSLTGWPVRYLASVSVMAELCTVAGSAATIALLLEEQGPDWLEQLGLPHLWVSVDGQIGGSLAASVTTSTGH